ncbi:MAG TPA: class I SAM-dependent methyltransferase [Clostridia bacterium]|nr:class I SAM-dependent methyltransferase [Clostridia bacterium]
MRSGHPWVFANSIREQNRPGAMGELAVVYDRQNRFLAFGLLDPASPIRLRILHRSKPQTVNPEWWALRFGAAIDRRTALFDPQTTGFRWINGESDGWPGLVLDRYGATLVFKLYTGAWLPRLDEICDLAARNLQPESIVLRLSRNLQEFARAQFHRTDGQILLGRSVEGPVVFEETGLRFEADVVRGQKTGFFLDQRENRRRVERLAQGRRVLNAFSFSGGFSLYAARGGARSVTDLDLSPHALESARRNFKLNNSVPQVASARHQQIQADAFDWLKENGAGQFDLVVLDPPSLARREAERHTARRAYARLAGSGLRALARGGILVACSCSAHVSAAEFFEEVRHAAQASGRPWRELETTGHAPDHPATFKEAEYLKAIYLRLTD